MEMGMDDKNNVRENIYKHLSLKVQATLNYCFDFALELEGKWAKGKKEIPKDVQRFKIGNSPLWEKE